MKSMINLQNTNLKSEKIMNINFLRGSKFEGRSLSTSTDRSNRVGRNKQHPVGGGKKCNCVSRSLQPNQVHQSEVVLEEETVNMADQEVKSSRNHC